MSLFSGKRKDEGLGGVNRTHTAFETASPASLGSPTADAERGNRAEARGEGLAPERLREHVADPRHEGVRVANIGKSIIFKGELSGDEDLEIEGKIEGRIDLPKGMLTIGSHGQVRAEVNAKAVVVIGHIAGNVSATERVEVQASGVVEGDIRAPRLVIQEGAVVNGGLEMTKADSPPVRKPDAPAPSVVVGGAARQAG